MIGSTRPSVLALTLAVSASACATGHRDGGFAFDEHGSDPSVEGRDPNDTKEDNDRPPRDGDDDGDDAGKRDDASVGTPTIGPRVSCAGTLCRSDQTCEQGVCTFACTGTRVPGDYATLSEAVSALAAAGNDATICFSGQTGQSVIVTDSAEHNKALRVIGVSAEKTSLGDLRVAGGFSDVSLVGFTVQVLAIHDAKKVSLRGVRISGTSQALTLRQSSYKPGQVAEIDIDGCDISSSTSGRAINIDSVYAYPWTISLSNSWVHGGDFGIFLSSSSDSKLSLSIINNTITGSKTGIYLAGSSLSTITYANNILANHTSAAVNVAGGTTVVHANNALFGNASNYTNLAVDGAGYVKQDCMLDTSGRVPELKPGSPCRGAADASKAPPSDFWNAPRKAPVDLGAVESP